MGKREIKKEMKVLQSFPFCCIIKEENSTENEVR
jgi:hypothetical protein